MANHQSTKKRMRQNEERKLHNRYYAKTMRNAVKKLRDTSNKEEAKTFYPQVASIIDKLAKSNSIHKNKAANLKSSLAKYVQSL